MGSRRMWCYTILALQILSCCFVSVTSRPFASSNHDALVQNGLNQTVAGQRADESRNESGGKHWSGPLDPVYSRISRKIGSSPPSCEHKCYGCNPCEAIQVPTISKKHNQLSVQYTNYEPGGWKCKCGSSYFNP